MRFVFAFLFSLFEVLATSCSICKLNKVGILVVATFFESAGYQKKIAWLALESSCSLATWQASWASKNVPWLPCDTETEAKVKLHTILSILPLVQTESWPAKSAPLSCNPILHTEILINRLQGKQANKTHHRTETKILLQFFPMLTAAWRLLQSILPTIGSVLCLWSSCFFVFLIKKITSQHQKHYVVSSCILYCMRSQAARQIKSWRRLTPPYRVSPCPARSASGLRLGPHTPIHHSHRCSRGFPCSCPHKPEK